jgi:dihydroxy-acid dehydratase
MERVFKYVSAFEALGKSSITITPEDFKGYSKRMSGAGACGGMYTANTMSSAIEALGVYHIVLLTQL